MAPSVVLLLLALRNAAASPPRTSFLLNSAERPLIHFSLPDVHNTTTLLLSNDRSTLYVGARDAVLSLDISQSDVITLKEKVQWSPSDSEINDCRLKAKNATVDCPNFIRVLQLINSTHLYACGSYAYSPRDAFIDTESFSLIQHGGAKGRCPFSPVQRNTAITIGGELFTATTGDFKGVQPQISRHFSKDGRPDVSQDHSVSSLEEPNFVSSSSDPDGRKLYFFFSEVGKEFRFPDELRTARVAQICKDDVGGQRTLQKKWTSFAKAPLLCQSSKQLPFNDLQDVFTLQPPGGGDILFYGVFTSQWSSSASAVCVFRLQDVRTAFSGRYRTFNMQTHLWSPLVDKHAHLGQCGLESASDTVLAEVKKSFLTSSSVTPVGGGPILVSSQQRYSRVAAMRTQAANGKQYDIIFLLTESGFLHKVVLFDRGAQVIEEIQVFTQPQMVKNIVLSSSKGVLYVGTSQGVTAVPVARCSIYRSCSQCVLARDPLCGWSRSRKLCSHVDGGSDDTVQVLENGNVEEECLGETEAGPPTDVHFRLNDVVTLTCLKPSNLATLTWTSSRFKVLPQKLFIHLEDGSLKFFAATETFGTYRCEAEEGGYKEVVTGYDVQQIPAPRSMGPPPGTGTTQESFDRTTEEPVLKKQPAGDAEVDLTHDQYFNLYDTFQESPGVALTFTPTSRTWQEPPEVVGLGKSYYSELIVVSLLLATCLLMFAGLHMWRRGRASLNCGVSPEDSSKVDKSMEDIRSLSSLEDGGPELQLAQ